jgi:Inositol monophosphatase family
MIQLGCETFVTLLNLLCTFCADATYQYIEGGDGTVSDIGVVSDGLRCVTVLIGAYDLQTGRPIIGCVNQPFSTQDPVSRRYN